MNKTVLISGVSKGLGRELAKKYLAEGDTVIGISRSFIFDDIVFSSDKFVHIESDLSVVENIDNIINEISSKYRIEVLVLNSANYTDKENIVFISNLNFTASIYLLHKIIILGELNKTKIDVLYISSVTAMLPDVNYLYSATKAGHTFAIRGMRYLNKDVFFKIFYLGPFSSIINPRPNFTKVDKVADFIYLKSQKTGNSNHYFPRYVFLFKFFNLLPDRVYQFTMNYLKKL